VTAAWTGHEGPPAPMPCLNCGQLTDTPTCCDACLPYLAVALAIAGAGETTVAQAVDIVAAIEGWQR
jgi:hypothetical protein